MAGVSQIGQLEARKRALVTECEICRETLKAEVDNLRVYSAHFGQKFSLVRRVGPWVMMAGPLVLPALSFFMGRKKAEASPPKIKGRLATALVAFRMYRKYAPMLRGLVDHFNARRRANREARSPAANI